MFIVTLQFSTQTTNSPPCVRFLYTLSPTWWVHILGPTYLPSTFPIRKERLPPSPCPDETRHHPQKGAPHPHPNVFSSLKKVLGVWQLQVSLAGGSVPGRPTSRWSTFLRGVGWGCRLLRGKFTVIWKTILWDLIPAEYDLDRPSVHSV